MPAEARHLKKKAEINAGVYASIDWPFAILVLTILAFGLVMMFSASYASAWYREGDSLYYIKRQLLFAVLGVVVMFVAPHFDYHLLHKFAWPLMGVTALLLVVVLFMPETKGTTRWIYLPGGGSIQPSEIAKFAVIVLFAHIISLNHKKMKSFSYGVLPFLVILVGIAGLMLLEPHLSGTLLIFAIGAVMMFVGGTSLVWFGLAIGLAVMAVAGAVILVPDLVPYAMTRINYWQDPWQDMAGAGYQVVQSIYAIGSGGLFGLGIGNSKQKHLYLPEPQNDFVFSIVCEELGFVGAVMVILLFAALLWRGIVIAYKAKDKFGSLIVVGIITQVTVQAALNIAVVTKTIPNTGISLPFFSYGGSSLSMLLGEMGIVLAVSRHSSVGRI